MDHKDRQTTIPETPPHIPSSIIPSYTHVVESWRNTSKIVNHQMELIIITSTDSQTDRQTDRWTDGQANEFTDNQDRQCLLTITFPLIWKLLHTSSIKHSPTQPLYDSNIRLSFFVPQKTDFVSKFKTDQASSLTNNNFTNRRLAKQMK